MEREEFLHFDSLNAIKSTDVFHATFNLQKTYTKIKNIHIKNVEFPICFPNIRSSNLSNNMGVTDLGHDGHNATVLNGFSSKS